VLDFGIADTGWVKKRPRLDRMRDARLHGSGADHPNPEAGPSADIWSLCAVLYEVIVGAVRPRWCVRRDVAKVHLELRAIVERGLSEAPSARWRSMTELGEALANGSSSVASRGLPRRFIARSVAVCTRHRHRRRLEHSHYLVQSGRSRLSDVLLSRDLGSVHIPRNRIGLFLLAGAGVAVIAASVLIARSILVPSSVAATRVGRGQCSSANEWRCQSGNRATLFPCAHDSSLGERHGSFAPSASNVSPDPRQPRVGLYRGYRRYRRLPVRQPPIPRRRRPRLSPSRARSLSRRIPNLIRRLTPKTFDGRRASRKRTGTSRLRLMTRQISQT